MAERRGFRPRGYWPKRAIEADNFFVFYLKVFFLVILPFIFYFGLVMGVHEYGHYAEMRSRGISVEEFSLGVGWKLYQYKQGECTFSIRAIPIMAYVKPTTDGQKKIDGLPLWDKAIIYTAGVRNNFLFAIILVLLWQFYLVLKNKMDYQSWLANIVTIPLKIFLLYPCFAVDALTLSKFDLCSRLIIPVKKTGLFIECDFAWLILFNLALGFFNLMPLYPMDGGLLFFAIASGFLNSHPVLSSLIAVASMIIIFLIVFFGRINTSFIEYED